MAYNRNALATETTCASLFMLAEEWGEAVIQLPDEHQCIVLRNRLYKWRSRLRKNAGEVTGVQTTPYDGFTFSYTDEGSHWRFLISYDIPMVLVIEIPDYILPEELPQFDSPEPAPDIAPDLDDDVPF